MSKERYNQIIDDVYKNYKSLTHNKNEKNGNYGDYSKWVDNPLISGVQHLTKDSFIQLIKIDADFSQRWGLKIEERVLSLEERAEWLQNNKEYDLLVGNLEHDHIREVVEEESPTRITTITYKNETIETYE